VNEQDEKDFEELMWKPKLSLHWNDVARSDFLDIWLEARRTLREDWENGCRMDEDEEFDCPIHGKLGGIDECPKC